MVWVFSVCEGLGMGTRNLGSQRRAYVVIRAMWSNTRYMYPDTHSGNICVTFEPENRFYDISR